MLRTMLAQQAGLRVGGEVCNGGALKWWPTWTDMPVPHTLRHHTLVKEAETHVQLSWNAFDIWNLHDRWQWNPNWANETHIDTVWHDALLKDPTFKVVWLEREDKIAQSMSFMLAHRILKPNEWIRYDDDNNTTSARFSLNAQEVKRFTEVFTAYRALIKRKFMPYNLPSISLTYEQLRSNPNKAIKRVTDWLGTPHTPCKPRTKVTFTTPLHKLVTNYYEIVHHVRRNSCVLDADL